MLRLSSLTTGDTEVSHTTLSQGHKRLLLTPIDDFLTSDQAISEHTMKDMLISLRSTLHNDIQSIVTMLDTEIKDIGDRVS